jgi:predicted MFS family arabinose efflux permease
MFMLFGGLLFVVNFVTILLLIRDKVEDVAKAARKAGRLEELAAVEAPPEAGKGTAAGSVYVGWEWREAIRTKAFWLIALAQLASFVSIFSILNQLGKHLEIVGISLSVAGSTLGLLGLFGLIGKFVFGYAAEKFPVRFVFAFCLGLQMVGLLILHLITSEAQVWLLFPFVAVFGLGFGAMGVVQPLIMLETFGLIAYATISAVIQLILSPFNTVAPTAVGAIVDNTGTYFPILTAGVFFLAIGAVAVVVARPPVKAAAPQPQAAFVSPP